MSNSTDRQILNLERRVAQLEALPGGSVLGGGNGASPRVAYWTSANSLSSDAGVLLNAAGDGIGLLLLSNQTTLGGVERQVKRVTNIADNVATAVFTVTTTNETGSNDGGVYVCRVVAAVSHNGTSTTTNDAVKVYRGSFSRAMLGAGTGVLTAVEDNFTGASAATTPATSDIATITMTVAETTEYVITASMAIDLTGTTIGTAQVTALVEVVWGGFLTAPTIA